MVDLVMTGSAMVRARQRLIRQNRGNAHDVPGLLFAHLRHHLLRYEKVSGDVRADHHFKILRRIFGERLRTCRCPRC